MKVGCLGRVELSRLGHMDEFLLDRYCAKFREAQCIRPGNVPWLSFSYNCRLAEFAADSR